MTRREEKFENHTFRPAPSGVARLFLDAAIYTGRRAKEIQRLHLQEAAPSIAETILESATGGTGNSSAAQSCARLYLALQGMAIPLDLAGLDSTRLDWWLQAISERATGRWKGNEQGMVAIAAAHPLIWNQAQAATKAWEVIS